jgi:hypothetical protein
MNSITANNVSLTVAGFDNLLGLKQGSAKKVDPRACRFGCRISMQSHERLGFRKVTVRFTNFVIIFDYRDGDFLVDF